MTAMPVAVDVVSDVMCPWCYIGKRRLETAIGRTDLPVLVRWHPYQLDPTIPADGMDRKLYLERKFGSSDNVERVYAPVRAAGEAEDIPFAFQKITRSPNTLDAHRLIRWAAAADLQDAMVERLFRLYFVEGGNLSDRRVLADAAAEAGLERPVVERLLAGEADRAEVEAEIERARQIGVTGVPTFLVGGRYAVIGAREPEVLAGAIAKAAAEQAADAPALRATS